ncbi:MAG: hypothetical protein M1115_04545, partial [Actinobacteria bacterium]|nr:hypothetical protein [Actinomycetota bacterium]
MQPQPAHLELAGVFSGFDRFHSAARELTAAAKAPVHAYLLLGPSGTGGAELARAFSAALICPQGGCGECETCHRVRKGVHPDLVQISHAGAFYSIEEAREIVRVAARRPMEAARQVIVVPDIQLAERAGPALLKTVEEPGPSTVFVMLGEHVPPSLITLSSRCVQVQLNALSEETIVEILESEGVDRHVAEEAAKASAGRLDRARLLVTDAGLAARRRMWAGLLGQLDGSGATVSRLVGEVEDALNRALEPLSAKQSSEIAALVDQARKMGGGGGANRREMEERHKRELRRWRSEELRFGLSVLARVCIKGPPTADSLRA